MSPLRGIDGREDGNEKAVEEEEEDVSGSEEDDGLDEDMEALRRACMLTGVTPDGGSGGGERLLDSAAGTTRGEDDGWGAGASLDSDNEDDVELLRNIRSRFSVTGPSEPLSMQPLCALSPAGFSDDDDEDDFETLRAIQRRFSAFDNADTVKSCTKDPLQNQQQVHAFGIASDNETSTDVLSKSNTFEGFPDCQQSHDTNPNSAAASNNVSPCDEIENMAIQPSEVDSSEQGASKTSVASLVHSSFPESAQAFVDAIKRNRSYQRFLRTKLAHIEAKIEKNKKLTERVKILRNFQASCKKITGRALSQKKDPRVELISARKSRLHDVAEENDKKGSPMQYGPCENSHVPNYWMALAKFPVSMDRKHWSREETQSLAEGIKQQLQEMMLQLSVDRFSCSDGSFGDKDDLDQILASIKGLEVTPEIIRQFLPKVNWDQLASMYLKGRTGAECETRWLNWDDPLINQGPWTAEEENNLIGIIQEKGIKDWLDIAVSLGTNRTPFQCLARYQRSLNASILKKDWSQEEDDQLRLAVELYGEHDWQSVASMLTGRTGTQCSNRWKKSIHPFIQIKGKWTPDEDKRLKVAVMLFGAANWNKIAQFVPGRIQTQCRERWKNSLDPSINHSKWTEEEDERLIAGVARHGNCWSKVATHVPARTDNQCWRRWKTLFPEEVPLMQEARRLKRESIVRNFVDREAERPAILPSNMMLLPMTSSVSEPYSLEKSRTKRRREPELVNEKDDASIHAKKKTRSKRARKGMEEKDAKKMRSDRARQGRREKDARKKMRSKGARKGRERLSQLSGSTNGLEIEVHESNVAPRTGTADICSEQENEYGPCQAGSSHLTSASLRLTDGEADGARDNNCHKNCSAINRCTALDVRSRNSIQVPSESCESGVSTGVNTHRSRRSNRKKKRGSDKRVTERAESGICINSLPSSGDSPFLASMSVKGIAGSIVGRGRTFNRKTKKATTGLDNPSDAITLNECRGVDASSMVTTAESDSGDWDVPLLSFIRKKSKGERLR